MRVSDFLVEIGVEELPPKSLPALERSFREAFAEGLEQAGLAYESVESFAAPRRLALLARKLAARQPAQVVERRGPPLTAARDAQGQWSRAAEAFARSCGCRPQDLDTLRTEKGAWLAFRETRAGRPAAALLPEIVTDALKRLPIARAMRWGEGEVEFIRPVHWVVMLRGKTVVPARILGRRSGRVSQGHRFMGKKRVSLKAAQDYAAALRQEGKVMADFAARRATMLDLARKQAAGLGGKLVSNPALEDEITGLVEWPVALRGSIERRFLELPDAAIIATLQEHLRFFPVRGASGGLLAGFVLISNLESRQPESIAAGAERVVRARLNDADFFYRRDCGETLASRLPGLDAVRYQDRLGSLGDRAGRLAALAEDLAPATGAETAAARRAALLCKTDLLTGMVGEFPGLQGTMGEHYARKEGEDETVCVAIGEHYSPRLAGDPIPASAAGRAVALADRLDSLAGLFATGKRPKGASDPFGQRRAALGVLRICIEGSVSLDLPHILEQAMSRQPLEIPDEREAAEQVHAFMLDRLKAWYLEGLHPEASDMVVTAERFAAVRARNPSCPLDFHRRLKALHGFLGRDAADDLAAANKRIANILRSADTDAGDVEAGLLRDAEESALHSAFLHLLPQFRGQLKARDYAGALDSLCTLGEPLSGFFDHVLVMSEEPDLRRNRLALLAGIRNTLLQVADLSLLPGRR
ncbi:glycine--tRNA ligase subunit beta [Candidatus Foliamicus sp.]